MIKDELIAEITASRANYEQYLPLAKDIITGYVGRNMGHFPNANEIIEQRMKMFDDAAAWFDVAHAKVDGMTGAYQMPLPPKFEYRGHDLKEKFKLYSSVVGLLRDDLIATMGNDTSFQIVEVEFCRFKSESGPLEEMDLVHDIFMQGRSRTIVIDFADANDAMLYRLATA